MSAHWIDLDSKGENTGVRYHGRFNLKPFLTHKERTEAIVLAEKYCFGVIDNAIHRSFLTAMAFLKSHIIETDAEWWNKAFGQDLEDEAPIYALVDKLKEVQDKLRIKDPEEDQKTTEE